MKSTISNILEPLDLVGFQFYRRFAAEHRDQYFHFASLFIYFPHFALEILKWSVDNDDRIAFTEIYRVPDGLARGALEDLFYFVAAQGHGLVGRADKAGHLWGIAHDAPSVVGRDHLHQDVALEKF